MLHSSISNYSIFAPCTGAFVIIANIDGFFKGFF